LACSGLNVDSVMLRCGDGETQRQVRFADTKWPERLSATVFWGRTAASMGGRRVSIVDSYQRLTPHDPGGSRTRDLRIKSPLLYQLSYRVGDRTKFA
jgi:hypothetical protein